MMTHLATAILLLLLPASIYGFGTHPLQNLQHCTRVSSALYSEVVEKANVEESSSADDTTTSATIETDPKEAVKLFGRLAEKYISELQFSTTIPCAVTVKCSLSQTCIYSLYTWLFHFTVLDASAGMCCYSACSGEVVALLVSPLYKNFGHKFRSGVCLSFGYFVSLTFHFYCTQIYCLNEFCMMNNVYHVTIQCI